MISKRRERPTTLVRLSGQQGRRQTGGDDLLQWITRPLQELLGNPGQAFSDVWTLATKSRTSQIHPGSGVVVSLRAIRKGYEMKNLLKYGAILMVVLLVGVAATMLSFPRVEAQDVDQQRVIEIAKQIASTLGENNPTVEIARPVIPGQVSLVDLSEIRVPLDPQERLWEIRLRGRFTILAGPSSVRAIHSDGLVIILRASDGSVFAMGTAGNTTIERVED